MQLPVTCHVTVNLYLSSSQRVALTCYPLTMASLTMLHYDCCTCMQALPSAFTLSLLLLACWQAREPVSPLDIVRWALNGELPFMTFAADSRDLLEPFPTLLTPGFLLPAGK